MKVNLNLVSTTVLQQDEAAGNGAWSDALGFFDLPAGVQNYFLGGAGLNWQRFSGADSLIEKAARTIWLRRRRFGSKSTTRFSLTWRCCRRVHVGELLRRRLWLRRGAVRTRQSRSRAAGMEPTWRP